MAETSGNPPVLSVEQQVLAEHRRIRELTGRLENAPSLPEVLRLLREFRTLLVPHFQLEEAPDGLYESIRRLSPRQLGRLADLEHEHAAFLADIDRLAEQVRACLAGPVASVLAGARALARRVKEHEAREDELLLDTLYTDLGHGE